MMGDRVGYRCTGQSSLHLPPPHSITFAGGPGRDGTIDFTPGSELLITKAKNGHLAVVSGNGSNTLPPRDPPIPARLQF